MTIFAIVPVFLAGFDSPVDCGGQMSTARSDSSARLGGVSPDRLSDMWLRRATSRAAIDPGTIALPPNDKA